VDTERHMKTHHSERRVKCNVAGCLSENSFTEAGLTSHRRAMHPATFYRERNERRRHKRSSLSWFSEPGRSLAEADPATVESELDKASGLLKLCHIKD